MRKRFNHLFAALSVAGLSLLLLALGIGILLFMLQSCSSAKKTFTKEVTKVDSAHVVKNIAEAKTDSSGTKKYLLQDWYQKTTVIDFDTSATSAPLKLYRRGDGSFTSVPAIICDMQDPVWIAKPVRITINETGTKKTAGEETAIKNSSFTAQKFDSAKVTKQQTTTTKSKSKKKIKWLWLLLILVPVALYYFRDKIFPISFLNILSNVNRKRLPGGIKNNSV